MSRGVNQVFLVGNAGRDPEMKYTSDGKAVARLSLATSSGGKGSEKTEWHSVVLWEKLAEVAAEYVTKGSQVCVQGRIQSRKYTDNSGNERTAYEIIAHNLTLLGGAKERAAPADDDDF